MHHRLTPLKLTEWLLLEDEEDSVNQLDVFDEVVELVEDQQLRHKEATNRLT